MALTYDGSGKAAGLRALRQRRARGRRRRARRPGRIDSPPTRRCASAASARAALRRADRRPAPLQPRADARADRGARDPPPAARHPLRACSASASKDDAADVRDYFLTYAAPDALRTAYADLKALRQEKDDSRSRSRPRWSWPRWPSRGTRSCSARGDYRNQTEKVQPGVPAMLPPLPKDAPLNRLTLAKWLVDPGHPLTARVAVNRFWQMYFGMGIVKTQEDFGVQGEPPVTSGAARLARDRVRPDRLGRPRHAAADRHVGDVSPVVEGHAGPAREGSGEPAARARAARAAAGGDDSRHGARGERAARRRIGGPSVMPYQPPGTLGGDGVRRGLLGPAVRAEPRQGPVSARHVYALEADRAACVARDVRRAVAEKCTARRGQTNTPLQALALLNDPTYVEAARARWRSARCSKAGRTTRRRDRVRVPPGHRAEAERQGRRSRSCGRCSTGGSSLTARIARPRKLLASANRRATAARRRRARGVDHRRERDPEPGRDDHQAVTMRRNVRSRNPELMNTTGRSMESNSNSICISRARSSSAARRRASASAALATLLGPDLACRGGLDQARDPKTGGLVGLPHFAPKAKRVIFLHQSGGPSQLETFDYKPALAKFQGTQIPDSVRKGQRVAQTMGQSPLLVRAIDVHVRAVRPVGHVGQRAACRTPRRSSTTSPSSRR